MKAFLVCLSALYGAAVSAAPPGELAKRLVEIRSEVEEAGAAYEEALQKRKSLLDPLQMRHSELEAQLAKEELREAQLKEKLKALGGRQGGAGARGADEWKALESWARNLGRLVDDSMPFRRKERREKVRALEERIRLRRESPVSVSAELWSATEKELLITRDVEYRISKLPLPAGEAELEVARLGMAHLVFRGPGGAAGYSSRKNGKWEFVAASGSDEIAAIDRLVGRLKAKSVNGWYEVPGLGGVPREEIE